MFSEWFFICHLPAMLPPSPALPFRATDQVCLQTLSSPAFRRRSGDLRTTFQGRSRIGGPSPGLSSLLHSCFILLVVGSPSPARPQQDNSITPGSGQEQPLPGAQYSRKVTLIPEGADSWPMEGPLSWGTCPPPVSSYR